MNRERIQAISNSNVTSATPFAGCLSAFGVVDPIRCGSCHRLDARWSNSRHTRRPPRGGCPFEKLEAFEHGWGGRTFFCSLTTRPPHPTSAPETGELRRGRRKSRLAKSLMQSDARQSTSDLLNWVLERYVTETVVHEPASRCGIAKTGRVETVSHGRGRGRIDAEAAVAAMNRGSQELGPPARDSGQ